MRTTLTFDSNNTATILGELSFATVPDLILQTDSLFNSSNKSLDKKIENRTNKKLNFNFEKVERCDSAGIALLLHWLQRAKKTGRSICFSNFTEQMMHIINLCELEELFSNNKIPPELYLRNNNG